MLVMLRLDVIPKQRLPTELQVLGHYLYLLALETSNKDSVTMAVATQVVDTVIEIWNTAFIPHNKKKNVLRQFFSKSGVLERYKYANKRREARLPVLVDSMSKELFDISTRNPSFRNEEDRVFFNTKRGSDCLLLGHLM